LFQELARTRADRPQLTNEQIDAARRADRP
jgi:Arc/MetJ family transcription regulator